MKLLLRILIVLGVPGKPAACGQLNLGKQRLFRNDIGTDDVDGVNLCDFALFDHDRNASAVTLKRCKGSCDLYIITATRQILLFDFLFGFVENGSIKDTAFGQTRVAQCFFERVFIKLFGTGDIDGGNRRPLDHRHNHNPFQCLNAHVAEETSGE